MRLSFPLEPKFPFAIQTKEMESKLSSVYKEMESKFRMISFKESSSLSALRRMCEAEREIRSERFEDRERYRHC